MEKFKKISFILAAVFILVALGIKLSKPEYQQYANYAVIAGIVFFLLSLWFERKELKTFFTARSTKYGLNSLVMIILVLAIVILANWLINKHPYRYDTTKNQQFSLSPLTVNTLKTLKQPVKITAFFTEGQEDGIRERMKDLLDNYRVTQPKMLEVKLIDPRKNPQLTQQYAIDTNGTTVLEAGGQKQSITTTNEEDLTNAILKVTSNKQATVYFLTGHGEPSITGMDSKGFSGIAEQLKKTNYVVNELKDFAAKPKVPDDCSVLIIAASTGALLDHEIKGITDYLASGGRVLFLDDPQADPSATKILTPYNVTARDDIVVDDQYFFPLADPAVPQVTPLPGTAVTKEFNFPMFFALARSIEYKQTQGTKESFTPFAQTSQYSWGETDKKTAKFDEGKDIKGPLTVGLLVTLPLDKKDDQRSNEMRMVVFGDSTFAQNDFARIPGNVRIFSNAVAWLSEQENLIQLPPRNEKNDVMMLNSTQLNYLGLFLVIVLPAIVIGSGVTVWLRRKKL
ncbi:MAG TPA: Gldg family protein [Acidobacteriota bacterium]|nr:Gldg family protein [Acidobacteriota bacterium]